MVLGLSACGTTTVPQGQALATQVVAGVGRGRRKGQSMRRET